LIYNRKNEKTKTMEYINNKKELALFEKIDILSWNIHYFRDKQLKYTYSDCLKYIEKIDTNIICLQEVYNIPGITPWNIKKDLNNLGYSYIISDKNNGLLCASKFKPIHKSIIKFNNKRGYILLKFDNRIIINTHLEVSDEGTRVKQINKILSDIINIETPIIICGDLNTIDKNDYTDEEWDHNLIYIRKYMFDPKVTDILKNNKFIDVGNYLNKNKINTSFYDRRVDYFFVKNIKPNNYIVDESNILSDHYPILYN